MATYREADLQQHIQDILDARKLWAQRCAEYVVKHGDVGTCVTGAGIAVDYLPPRRRKSVEKTILRVPDTAAQGSCTWEASVPEVIEFLRARGIEAHYKCGWMD